MEDNRREFTWHEFDANPLLPKGWAGQILSFALGIAESRILVATSVTSRESTRNLKIPILTVGGLKIREGLPWLFDLYRGIFRNIGQTCVDEPVSVSADVRHAVNINIQRGMDMRYECHIDSNPLSALLYVTSHDASAGGELVVANRADALGVKDISEDCKRIYPHSGKLVFFDAREHPHFAAPLNDPFAHRVVVVMNFYTPSCPETARPDDLTRHMFGED